MKFAEYIIPCVAVLLIVYFFCKPPKFVFRKLLHLVAFSCVTVMILLGDSWAAASLASVFITVIVYPILSLLEKKKWFTDLFVQKSEGEIKRSLVMLFMMFAALTAVSWGIFDNKTAGTAAILMWGTGDAAAALVGIPFGKHKVISRFTDGKKSYEGSSAMFFTAFLCGIVFLRLYAGADLSKAVLPVLAGGAVGTLTELVTSSEWDTVTVPLAILIVMLFLF